MRLKTMTAVLAVLFGFSALGLAVDDEPWIITTAVVITEPVELGHVILLDGGSLNVLDLPEPGLEMRGHIWATGSSTVRFENSVIQFLSVYHGQYSVVAADTAKVEVSGCDYRVPAGVQHALFAVEQGTIEIDTTIFDDVQLISSHTSTFEASSLDGHFEVLVQDESTMRLADIPRSPEGGSVWVWVEFPTGSEAVYSPPLPGYVESWTFPPPDATGIEQTATIDRCEVLLWPMLVRAGSRVVLRDIPDDHWVVVGFHMPHDGTIDGLINDLTYADHTLDLDDREFRLVNATVDTWNLYPQAHAHVQVRDSLLGEILSLEDSRVTMERTTIDGTGGFFGARDTSRITATDCVFTCTIEATQQSTVVLRSSSVEPYPIDPTGAYTRFGAYDDGRLFADQTAILTTPALSGRGLIAVSYLDDPPVHPPGSGGVTLEGSIAQFSLEPEVATGSWRLEASGRDGGVPTLIGHDEENVEGGILGIWYDADPAIDHRLQTTLTDGLGRTLVGNLVVPGSNPRVR